MQREVTAASGTRYDAWASRFVCPSSQVARTVNLDRGGEKRNNKSWKTLDIKYHRGLRGIKGW